MSKSGILILTIINALNNPTTKQAMIAILTLTRVACEYQTNIDMTTALDNEAVEPTDKSNPPTANEIVIPIAMIVTMEIDLRMVMTLLVCKKEEFASEKPTINKRIRMIVP